MEILLENALALSIIVTIAGIAFAAFIASPYEIYFEDADDTEEI